VTTLLVLVCIGWTVQIPVSGQAFGNAAYEATGAIRPSSLWDGEYARVLTSVFLHAGWLHLVFNALSLFVVGRVIEIGIGRPAYLLFLFASAIGGVVASLLWTDHEGWRMGISGGVFGLIGLVLALEWGVSRSWIGFLKSRNTIMVVVVLAINVGLALYFGTIQGAQIDHAGHAGGFACGLLGGLAYFPRSAIRPVRGTVVVLLLVLPALAYAAKPVWNPTYYAYRATKARLGGDDDGEIAAWRRYLELKPGEIRPATRLAWLEDSPEPLRGLVPLRARDANWVVRTWLELAIRRLDEEPGTASDHAVQAAAIAHAAVPDAWLRFGGLAEAAKQPKLAAYAFREAYTASQVLGRGTAHWQAARAMLLTVLREAGEDADDETFLRLLKLARESCPGLADLTGPQRDLLEQLILRVGASSIARARAKPGDERQALALPISELFGQIASHAPEEDPRIANFDLQMAVWWWVAAEDKDAEETREMGAGRFTTTLQSARRTKNEQVEAFAKEWFRTRNIPIPPPELAEPEDGG